MDHGIDFLQDLAVVMVTAGLTTILFHKLRQPVVLGYIIAGIIIGPYTPPMPLIKHEESIKTLAELGIIFLMFRMGLHFSLRKLFKIGAPALLAATFEIALMVFMGYQIGRWFGWTKTNSIFLGAMLSISSTTIIVKTLADLKMLQQNWVQLVFAILIGEDLVAITILAMLPVFARTGEVPLNEAMLVISELAIFLSVVLVAGLILIPKILRFVSKYKEDEMLLVTVLGLVFGTSLVAVHLGYSVALGAFIIGAIMAETKESGRIEHVIAPLRNMFSAVFFVAVGMLIQPELMISQTVPIIVITLTVILGKIVSCSAGSILAGNDTPTSIRVGMGLAQIGEFSFIIAQMGIALGLIEPFIYSIIVTVSAITVFTTPYLITWSNGFSNMLHAKMPRKIGLILGFYRQTLHNIRNGKYLQDEKRIQLRKLALQSLLNVLLVTGVFVAAAWANKKSLLNPIVNNAWTQRWVFWSTAMLISMPIVLGTLRKIQKIAIIMAEKTENQNTRAHQLFSSMLETVLLGGGAAAFGGWILVLSFTIVPHWYTLILLVLIASLLAFFFREPLLNIYRAGQDTLRQTLTGDNTPSPRSPEILEKIFQDTTLERIAVAPGSSAAGKLIRELHLRSRVGVTIVGIERDHKGVVNPGPDEEIMPNDVLLILGNAEQIVMARSYLMEIETAA